MTERPPAPMNYPSNSNKDRQEKRVERITTTDAISRKPPLSKRIAENFAGDDMQSVGGYVLFEVLLPAAKTAISDAVSQGIERLLFGATQTRRSGMGRTGSYTSYNRMYSGAPSRPEPRMVSRQARATHDFREVILGSRGEAEQVLDQLQALIDQYDVATVSDFYQLVGITSDFTEEKYGWNNLAQAGVRRVREGYLLDLPRPSVLD